MRRSPLSETTGRAISWTQLSKSHLGSANHSSSSHESSNHDEDLHSDDSPSHNDQSEDSDSDDSSENEVQARIELTKLMDPDQHMVVHDDSKTRIDMSQVNSGHGDESSSSQETEVNNIDDDDRSL